MARLEHAVAAVVIGLLLAWLALLETGWAHHWGWVWIVLHLGLTLACCVSAWWGLRWIVEYVEKH